MTGRELKQSLEGGESAMNILSAFMECIKQDTSTSDKNAGKIFLLPAINEVSILHWTLTMVANNLHIVFL